MTSTPTPAVALRAAEYLSDLLTQTGAEYATEQQWRAFCDRPELVRSHEFEDVVDHEGKPVLDHTGKPKKQPRDLRARGFQIPDMLERGLITQTLVAFHAPRGGQLQPPVAVYRLA